MVVDEERAKKIFLEVLGGKIRESTGRIEEIKMRLRELSKIPESDLTEDHYRELFNIILELRILNAGIDALFALMNMDIPSSLQLTYRV